MTITKLEIEPLALIISSPVWNALLNGTMDKIIDDIPPEIKGATLVTKLRSLDAAWKQFHQAENSIMGNYPLGNPYNPLNAGIAPSDLI